jgi:hypothetical protein
MIPTTIPLNTFFAVEIRGSESTHAVSAAICKAADEAKTLFLRLEVLDRIAVGGTQFVRYRSDILNPHPMLDLLFTQKRSIVQPSAKGYEVRFVSGRSGPVTSMLMLATPRLGQGELYKGPKVVGWEVAFR